MNKTVFKGTCTALITPFTEDGIDWTAFEKQILFQKENNVDALCVLGTTGESPTVSQSEYVDIIKFARKLIDGRIKFIVGSGSNSTKTAVYKSRIAEDLGADGLLIITPFYNKCTQNGLISYYNDIACSVNIPVICYNVPSRTGVNILPETVSVIADNPNIGGIKEACGNMSQIAETARLIRNKTALYSGDDNLNLAMYSIGAIGAISVASNILPKEVSAVFNYFFQGKHYKALEIHQKLLPLVNQLFKEVNPIPVKKAMQLLNMDSGILRPPLTELEKENVYNLTKELKNFGFQL